MGTVIDATPLAFVVPVYVPLSGPPVTVTVAPDDAAPAQVTVTVSVPVGSASGTLVCRPVDTLTDVAVVVCPFFVAVTV